ncbi:MAG: hypothetical protein Q9172_005893 [Xanthocarpia lactea]
MASGGKSRPCTEHLSQGLDRATYNIYHHLHRHLVAPLQPADPDERTSAGSPSLEDIKLGNDVILSEIVKAKGDVVFHPTQHNKENSSDSKTVPILAPSPPKDVENDRLFHSAPEQKGPSFKEVVKNPVSTVQSALHGASGAKFAETTDNQVIAHGAEVRLVRAFDQVVNANSGEDKVKAADNLEELEKARQDSCVRWTLDRHVLMVQRVPPHITLWPKLGDFRTRTQEGRKRVQWADYGHQILALVYLVLKRRLYPPTLEDMRGEIKRSEDVEMTALNITQLIEQHGSHGWTDALRQDRGPWLLLQLEDLANVLEIWK